MNRFLLAGAIVAAFGTCALAQAPVTPAQPVAPAIPNAGMPGSTILAVPGYTLPNGNPGKGYYVSGGAVAGYNGYYPFDSGYYQLGGTDGLARVTGFYTMVYPGGGSGNGSGNGEGNTGATTVPMGEPVYAAPSHFHQKKWFHRR